MSITLLATKLYRPSTPAKRVRRPHLVGRLNEGLAAGRRLVLVSAPAGFGKTTCVCEWLDEAGLPAAWLSLEQADNDPARFAAYLLAALQTAEPGIGREITTPAGAAMATLLANDILYVGRRLVLVLDDFHQIREQAILDMLQALMAGQPPNLCLVLVTREDPPLPLARLRANNQITEVRAADLRFSEDEAERLLNDLMDLALAPAELAALANRTEGWAAGLQLAGLSMRGRPDPASFIASLSGSHRFILSYLTEEVLDRQTAGIRDFLLQTSILENLNGDLCAAVIGRPDCATTLEQLYAGNLFLIPLDDEREWYRYHHLFAQLLATRLRQVLPAEEILGLHARASAWLAGHGFGDDAIRHALAARDYDRAMALVEQGARAMIYSGRHITLRAWLAALPAACDAANPRLEVYRTWIDLLQGKLDLGEAGMQARERMLTALPPSPENDRLRVELTAILCRYTPVFGDPARTIRLVQDALRSVPEADRVTRARLLFALGVAWGLQGDEAATGTAFEEGLRLARAGGDDGLAAEITNLQAQDHANHGRLREAARCYQAIIDMGATGEAALAASLSGHGGSRETGAVPAGAPAGMGSRPAGQDAFFRAGLGHLGLAGICLERDDLAQAEAHLARGTELSARGGPDGSYIAYALRARLLQARGDLAGASAEIDALEQAYRREDDPMILARRVAIARGRGDTRGLARLAEPWLRVVAGDDAGPHPSAVVLEVVKVAVARALLATGEATRALALLDEVRATAEPGGRRRPLLEACLLSALARQELAGGASTPEALAPFTTALALAEPEGYARLFLEEAPAVVSLLRAAADMPATPERLKQFAGRLLAAYGAAAGTGAEAVQRATEAHPRAAATGMSEAAEAPEATLEPLTEREREILRLIGDGCTNEEIAGRLVITLHTVKKHTSNIFGKLGVASRTQAVARGRRLGLLL